MRVPCGGSSCCVCVYVTRDGQHCANPGYVAISYRGKQSGDARFVDGKTGRVIANPSEFCCNYFDWPG